MRFEVLASAPGRLDFLNTHQDYKGLPVVSVAINLRTRAKAGRREGVCRAKSLNTGEYGEFKPGELPAGRSFIDYVKAAVASLMRSGVRIGGCDLEVDSEVPVASGMASSAALLVATVGALSALWGGSSEPSFVAEAAYVAEREIMGIPCGRLDQYGSAFGGISYINTKPPYNVERLSLEGGVFVALDSGLRHSTADIHPRRQKELDEGLRALMGITPPSIREKLAERHWEARWEELDEDELRPYLEKIPRVLANRILFTIRMHKSTLAALEILRGRKVAAPFLPELEGDDWRLKGVGAVMTYQHMLLRDLYDVSTPELDSLVSGALAKGAYGAKLSGAGLGGIVMALASEERAGSIKGLGEAKSWVLRVDEGLRVEFL